MASNCEWEKYVCSVPQLQKHQHELLEECEKLHQKVINHGQIIDQLPVCTCSVSAVGPKVTLQKESNAARGDSLLSKLWRARDEELERLKKECAGLKKAANDLQDDNVKLKRTVQSLQQKNDITEKQLDKTQKEASQLLKNNAELKNNMQSLKEKYEAALKLNERRKRKKATVMMYSPVRLSVVHQVLPELISQLEDLLSRDSIELNTEQVSEPGQIEASLPLLVICVNASRLGTDVDSALQDVLCGNGSMVVILHHKDTHALPSQSSDKILIGASYRALAGITDMAFTSTKGLYNCDMNHKGIEKIANFIIQRI